MQPTVFPRFVVLLALAVAGLMSMAPAARADTYVGRLIAEDLFDHLKFSGRIAVWPVDATQAREAGLTPSAAGMLADNIRVSVHKIGAAKGLTFVEREQISKVFQEQQFAHGAKDSDFETLAHDANADALVLITLERDSPTEIVVSARLVKAKGTGIGQIIATSKTYDVPMTQMAAAAPPVAPAKSNGVAIRQLPQDIPPVAPPPAPAVQPQTISPYTVTPTTAAAYGSYYYAPSYTSAYAAAPAVPYVYPAVRTYYAPYYRPRLAVAYAPAYRRWGRR